MKKAILLASMMASSVALANLKDDGKIGYITISNTSDSWIIVTSENAPSKSGLSKFKCLFTVPKKYSSGIPSPAFKTKVNKDGSSTTYFPVKTGQTIMYAFDSSCDGVGENYEDFKIAPQNKDENERLTLWHAYVNGNGIQYNNRLNNTEATFWGYVTGSNDMNLLINPIVFGKNANL